MTKQSDPLNRWREGQVVDFHLFDFQTAHQIVDFRFPGIIRNNLPDVVGRGRKNSLFYFWLLRFILLVELNRIAPVHDIVTRVCVVVNRRCAGGRRGTRWFGPARARFLRAKKLASMPAEDAIKRFSGSLF